MRILILMFCIYCTAVKAQTIISDTSYYDNGVGGWIKVVSYRNAATTPFLPKSDTNTVLATASRLATKTDSLASALAASTAATYATITTTNGKQATLVSATNIKTINGVTLLGSGNLATNTSTAGVGTTPTSTSTVTITHNLGRVPTIIRIYGYGTFTANASATATTSSMGVFNSSGNFCVYQRYGAAITTTQAGLTSNTFAILLATGGGSFISGVIQNVTSIDFQIAFTETGTATAQPYLWEAQ